MKDRTEIFSAYLNRHHLVRGGFVPVRWTSDGSGFLLADGIPQNTIISKVDLDTGNTTPLFDSREIRAALETATGHEAPYRGLPFDCFRLENAHRVRFAYDGAEWTWDLRSNSLERRSDADAFSKALGWVAESTSRPTTWTRYDYLSVSIGALEQPSPSGEWLAGVRDGNLVLKAANSRNDEQLILTTDGSAEHFWDIESTRFLITSGRRVAFRSVSPWSSDSLTLFACRRDLRNVPKIPRINSLKPFEDVQYFPCEKAGATLDQIQPFFLHVRSRRQVPVKLPELFDRYVQLLAWHPSGIEALIIVYTRNFKAVEVYAADRDSGDARLLLAESCKTFVKNQHDAIFSGVHGFTMLPDGDGFIWQSTRDGWNHLYAYDMDGRFLRQLTSGNWPITDVVHIAQGYVYFTASVDTARPYDIHVCRVPVQGGIVERLTKQPGIHSPAFAPSGKAFLDTHSMVNRPTCTDLIRSDGRVLRTVSRMDISRLKAVGYVAPEEFVVKAADKTTDLWGVLYKPFDFDPSRAYPVIEYIYGGPQTVEAPRFFAVDSMMMTTMKLPWALAHLGYIVICLDARGTPGRSKLFHDFVYRNWTGCIEDHAFAVKQLCARHNWLDPERVGITGHSWGGYFSTCALILAPDTYHAAVSYSPWYDPWSANIYEPYLDLPQNARSAYDQADLSRQAGQLKGRLLILTGTADDIGFLSTMKMTRALIDAGVEHELVVVPQGFHEFAETEEQYLIKKLTAWFERYVKERPSSRLDPQERQPTRAVGAITGGSSRAHQNTTTGS